MTKEQGFDSRIWGDRLRERAIRPLTKEVMLAKIPPEEVQGSKYAHINCDGYGLVRRSVTARPDWPKIDIVPELAAAKLGVTESETMSTQIFRDGICNFRCWYCFVDYKYMAANPRYGQFMTADNMVEMYATEQDRPKVLCLSGGQPDLLPEWTKWTMEALEARGMDKNTYLWQDDNLSSDSLWRHMSRPDIDYMRQYRNYGRAACLKGISPQSFYENTGSAPQNFETQLRTLKGIVDEGFDVYPYLVMLTSDLQAAHTDVRSLVDRLQQIHHYLPLKVFPSKVVEFPQTTRRMQPQQHNMLTNQSDVLDIWSEELAQRYSGPELSYPKSQISLK